MPDLKIEFELMPMPLPKEKEEAYWEAMRIVAEMIWKDMMAEDEENRRENEKKST